MGCGKKERRLFNESESGLAIAAGCGGMGDIGAVCPKSLSQGLNRLRKNPCFDPEVLKSIPRGLKPTHSVGLIGTTEVVP
jgi:hypothetical protein